MLACGRLCPQPHRTAPHPTPPHHTKLHRTAPHLNIPIPGSKNNTHHRQARTSGLAGGGLAWVKL
jgi:hypothetical protein